MHGLSHPRAVLDRLSPRQLAWLIVSSLFAALAFAYLRIAGSAVVVDETGEVASAAIVNGLGHRQPLYRLWPGYFYAIPKLEGEIEIRCHDGSRRSGGYVTDYQDAKLRVTNSKPCLDTAEANSPRSS
jgi:hypothetical protein